MLFSGPVSVFTGFTISAKVCLDMLKLCFERTKGTQRNVSVIRSLCQLGSTVAAEGRGKSRSRAYFVFFNQESAPIYTGF